MMAKKPACYVPTLSTSWFLWIHFMIQLLIHLLLHPHFTQTLDWALGRQMPWVQGSAVHSLAFWRHVCSSAAAGAGAGGLVPWSEGCLCPSTSQEASLGPEDPSVFTALCRHAVTLICKGDHQGNVLGISGCFVLWLPPHWCGDWL